ncbi:MAG TPA: YeeE/YedE family protein [Candidatus Binatia bacterium]|nr:YeeE/YedE family protein [Candidatus Binatia bacterium]
MENFTPYSATLGGMLIGVSASWLLLATGRIAGISGILGSLVVPTGADDKIWRALFLGGLIGGCWLVRVASGDAIEVTISASTKELVLAGLLVGFGTRVGSGCTSGHGVCGIARLSPRSIAATLTFMASGALTVFVMRHLLGG